jgi:hypothetical protein
MLINEIFLFSLDLSSLSAEYFSIDQSGVIRIKTSITSYGAGVMPLFYVLATDGGGTETRETVTVIITATTTTTTATTTDRYDVRYNVHIRVFKRPK